MFSVIDFETTGFSPARGDRVLEIGIVKLDETGLKIGEFTSIVNPEQECKTSKIHGLTPRVLRNAPRFRDIAGEILEFLDGSPTIAAHNFAFDVEFLEAEFSLLDVELPRYRGFCTMKKSGGGKLADCCTRYNIPLEHGTEFHCALDDARAAAGLLSYFIRRKGSIAKRHMAWPNLEVANRSAISRQAAFARLADEAKSNHNFEEMVSQSVIIMSENPHAGLCFTGEFGAELNGIFLNRKQIITRVSELGFQVKNAVTRNVHILIEEEHAWLTEKSKKARELGTLVVEPTVFAKALEHIMYCR